MGFCAATPGKDWPGSGSSALTSFVAHWPISQIDKDLNVWEMYLSQDWKQCGIHEHIEADMLPKASPEDLTGFHDVLTNCQTPWIVMCELFYHLPLDVCVIYAWERWEILLNLFILFLTLPNTQKFLQFQRTGAGFWEYCRWQVIRGLSNMLILEFDMQGSSSTLLKNSIPHNYASISWVNLFKMIPTVFTIPLTFWLTHQLDIQLNSLRYCGTDWKQ